MNEDATDRKRAAIIGDDVRRAVPPVGVPKDFRCSATETGGFFQREDLVREGHVLANEVVKLRVGWEGHYGER